MRCTIAAALVLVGTLGSSPTAHADDPPPFVVSAGPIEVDTSGDERSATITVTNLTDDELFVQIDAAGKACDTSDWMSVAERSALSVTFTLPDGCDPGEDGLTADLVGTFGGTEDAIEIELARKDPAPDPDYRVLLGFVYAGLVAATVALFINARSEVSLGAPLPSIDADWSFADSWATNLGVAATLFTGVFATTDVLEAVLGDQAAELPALALGGAVNAALIASGPLWLALFRSRDSDANTAGGLLAATTAVLTGNLGIVATAFAIFHDHEQLGTAAKAGAVIAVALLLWYTWATVPRTIRDGAAPAGPEGPGDAAVLATAITGAASSVAQAIRAGTGAPAASHPTPNTPVEAEFTAPRRRLTAMP